MKKHLSLIAVLALLLATACNSNKKSSEVASYTYEEEKVELNDKLTTKVGDWIEKDVVCYGIVVSVDEKGTPMFGKPVKAKVIAINNNEIKMKSLENVSLMEVQGCSKMGLSKGETWLEADGDLFKTKEEALAYLKKRNLIRKESAKAKV